MCLIIRGCLYTYALLYSLHLISLPFAYSSLIQSLFSFNPLPLHNASVYIRAPNVYRSKGVSPKSISPQDKHQVWTFSKAQVVVDDAEGTEPVLSCEGLFKAVFALKGTIRSCPCVGGLSAKRVPPQVGRRVQWGWRWIQRLDRSWMLTLAALQSHSATMVTSEFLAAPCHPFPSGNAHTWISTSGRTAV